MLAGVLLLVAHGAAGMAAMPGYELSWVLSESKLTITIDATTTGWVGFGLSENGGMHGADIMVASVDDTTGAGTIGDYWSATTAMPLPDERSSDWVLVEASQADGATHIVASRELDTGDTQDWPLVDNNGLPQQIIVAIGYTDTFSYHKEKASTSAYFFGGADPMVAIRADQELSTIDITADGFAIPQYCTQELLEQRANESSSAGSPTGLIDLCGWTPDTTYAQFCHVFPDEMAATHIVAIEALIDQTSLVHHYVLTGHPEADCGRGDDTQDWVWGWAPGTKPMVWPAQAGTLISGSVGGPGYRSVKLEIHYDNPAALAGLVDSSGVRAYTTTKLRQYDAGVIQTGDPMVALTSQGLPEGLSRYDFVCKSISTNQGYYEYVDRDGAYQVVDEITAFVHSHHMHQAGVKMETALHGRDGGLQRTMTSQYYDFNYQGARAQDFSDGAWALQAGSSTRVSCYYDTTRATEFGPGSLDEMCVDYIYVYPKPIDTICYMEELSPSAGFVGGAVPAQHQAPGAFLSRSFGAAALPPCADTVGWSHPVVGGCDRFSAAACETFGRDDFGQGAAVDRCCACRDAGACADHSAPLQLMVGEGTECDCHTACEATASLYGCYAFTLPTAIELAVPGCYDGETLQLLFATEQPDECGADESGSFFSIAVSYGAGCNRYQQGFLGAVCEADTSCAALVAAAANDCSLPASSYALGPTPLLIPDTETLAGMCPATCGCCDGQCTLVACPVGCKAAPRGIATGRRRDRRLLFGSLPQPGVPEPAVPEPNVPGPDACPSGCVPDLSHDDKPASVCYSAPGQQVRFCECHPTCAMCGYYDTPTAPEDCITCTDGGVVTPLFPDGTGTC